MAEDKEINTFERAKDFFKDADEETRSALVQLEKQFKSHQLYVNLGEHDAVKLLRKFIEDRIIVLNKQLQEQEVFTDEDKVRRAAWKAYRDTFVWFSNLFTIAQSKADAIEKRIQKAQG